MENAVPRNVDRTEQAERHVSWVRFVLILFNIVVYYFVMDPAGTIPWLAATISVVAGMYGALVVILRPYQMFGVMQSSWWTTGTDAGLIVLWLAATGGAASPFFLLWIVSLVAIGYRYGPKPTATATVMYVLLEAVFLATGDMLMSSVGLTRLAYIAFTGTVMMFASRYAILGIQKQESLQGLVEDLAHAKEDVDDVKGRLQSVLDNAPSIIFEVDLDGRICYINRTVEGMTKRQVLGREATLFMVEESQPVFREALNEAMDDARAVTVEVQGFGPDMSVRHYRSHLGPLQDTHGHVRGAIVITLDITDEKEQQVLAAESERHREHAARLEEEAQLRTRFINTAAHELNTPMTPLRLQMGVLRNVLGKSEHELRAVDIMERNLVRLGGLVTDLLDATRLQEGQLRVESREIELEPLMAEVVDTFEHVAGDRHLIFEVGVDPGIAAYADPQRVSQILFNLLSNALKFTPAGGRVQCEGHLVDGMVELAVTDTGPGFSEEERARLFMPFSQVHPSLVSEEPGTGLGLYLSRNLAEAQGGQLEVSSPGRGKGATFTLRLPRTAPDAGEEE